MTERTVARAKRLIRLRVAKRAKDFMAKFLSGGDLKFYLILSAAFLEICRIGRAIFFVSDTKGKRFFGSCYAMDGGYQG